MTTVLVTGATGFVGSHALEALAQRPKVKVIAACRDRHRLIPGFQGEVREGDLRDAEYRRRMLEGVDVVCHAAAWTSAWNYRENSERLFLQPSLALLDDAIVAGVGRFVFLSSTSAAAPHGAGDPLARGDIRRLRLWPHMQNVVRIEERMRAQAGRGTTMVVLRAGLFAGRRYGLGLLPLLTPRLKTHLVPWVAGGRTSMPIVAGPDLGAAFALAATARGMADFDAFFIVGPSVPTAREAIAFLHEEFGFPMPHFSVPFPMAYAFARLMEWSDPLVPWEPLVTRSIVHLLEETRPSNAKAERALGYRPTIDWRDAVRAQLEEMAVRQQRPMRMHVPLDG